MQLSKNARAIKVVGIILATLLLVQICFDPIAFIMIKNQNNRVQKELDIAKEKWESHKINDYTIDVKGSACFYNSRITIRNGVLYDVKTRQDFFDDTSAFIPVPREDWDSSFCNYTNLSIPDIFEKVENALKNADNTRRVIVSFDESYGFVTEFQYQCNVRSGLFDPKISDCDFRFDFSDFVIDNNPE